jgi:hypothetical protein
LALTSLLSRERTVELLAEVGLRAEVVSWRMDHLTHDYLDQREHLAHIQQLSDGYTLPLGDDDVLVTYLLEIRQASASRSDAELQWNGMA